jgi:CDP-4-dehydro-6-deoxyglucose reductase
MPFSIHLLPSDHHFVAEPRQPVLEAALLSGLSMDYGCNNGTCGECRARLIAGEVEPVRHHDYGFSAADRSQGWFLPCAFAARSNLVIEAREARAARDIPVKEINAKVARIEDAGTDIRILQLRTPRTNTLRFLAGQAVAVGFEGLAPRNLGIASCPCNGMVLQVHVCRVPDDPFSEYVFGGLRSGTQVTLQGPYGDFVFDEAADRPLLFMAHRTGFAFIKSLIEHAIALEWPHPMRLYWIAPSPAGHYLANQARAWEDALDDFRYTPLFQLENLHTHCIPATPAYGELREMVAALAGERPEYRDYEAYVAGPAELGQYVRDFVRPAGLHVRPTADR